MQTGKIIPDLATWIQCFGLYAAVLLKQRPEKASELIAYMTMHYCKGQCEIQMAFMARTSDRKLQETLPYPGQKQILAFRRSVLRAKA